MAPTVPVVHPSEFRSGDTMKFIASHSDFPAADGWVIAYTINGAVKKTGSVSTSGTETTVTLAASDSASLTAGTYTWQLTATKAATSERYTVLEGVVLVQANVAAAATLQSDAEVTLGYIRAELQARAQSDHTEYAVTGPGGDSRALKRESIETLRAWEKDLVGKIRRQRSGGRLGSIRTVFTKPGMS